MEQYQLEILKNLLVIFINEYEEEGTELWKDCISAVNCIEEQILINSIR